MKLKPILATTFFILAQAFADIELSASVVSIAPDPFTAWFCGNYTTCIIGVYAAALTIFLIIIAALLLGAKVVIQKKHPFVPGQPGQLRVYYPYWLSAEDEVIVGEVLQGVLKKKASIYTSDNKPVGKVKRLAGNREGELMNITEAGAGAYLEITISNDKRLKIQKGDTLLYKYLTKEDKEDKENDPDSEHE